MNKKYSKVIIRETNEAQRVIIGTGENPEIQDKLIEKWQSLLDTTAKIVNVPAGLIMKLNENTIEVFMKSNTEGNPYKVGDQEELIHRLYCETVIGKQEKLLVPNAKKSPIWKDNNPDVDINMISYLGFPINYPDGKVFGTVCLLDNKENYYNELYENLLKKVKEFIETDLELIVTNQQLKAKKKELEQSNDIKTKFLSLISHDIRGSIGTLDELLKILVTKIDEYSKDKFKATLQSLSYTSNSVYLTLENLLSWSKEDLLELEPETEQVNIVVVINKVLNFLKPRIDFKQLKIEKQFENENFYVSADFNMIESAIRNIVSNAVKFSYNEGTVSIKAYTRESKKIIEIKDYGTGMDQSTINKLFTYDRLSQKMGTSGEESSGIGLYLSYDFLKKNNASIDVESEKGKGTRFIVTF